jgi:exocyst complex protein 7
VKKHCNHVKDLAMNYPRVAWNKVLDCLKDARLYSKGNISGVVSKEIKERFKRLNVAFEYVYKTQTTWTMHDCELHEELQISIMKKLLLAYRSFQGR